MSRKIIGICLLVFFCSQNSIENQVYKIQNNPNLSQIKKAETIIKLVLGKKARKLQLEQKKIVLEYGGSTPLFFQNSQSYERQIKTDIAFALLKVLFFVDFFDFQEIQMSLIKPFYLKNTKDVVGDFEVFRVSFEKKHLENIPEWNKISPLTDFSRNRSSEVTLRETLIQIESHWEIQLNLLHRVELEDLIK